MSDERKQELSDLKKDDLQEIAEERGVEGASDLKKDELVDALAKEEHADSPEVTAALEEHVNIEYVGEYDIEPPGVIVPFLSDDQLGQPLKQGTSFSMPRSLAKGVLANAYFQPTGSDGERVRAELDEESRQATYEARAALAAPGSLVRDDQGGALNG